MPEISPQENGVDTRCGKCGYQWEYTGQMWRATCPRCGGKVKTHLYPDADEE